MEHQESPARAALVLLGFVLLGVAIHWLPNLGVPLHSDTAWIFRLMAAPASDVGLARAIPEAFRVLGAYPHDPLHAFLEWYRQTERFNVLDLTSLWVIARTSGGNADLWRLWSVIPLGLAVGLFYLLAERLRTPRALALLLALALLIAPVEVWVRYNTAEARGVFWVMIGLYFAARSGRLRDGAISAAAMLAAVLTKEPMLAGWVVVAGLIYHRTRLESADEGQSLGRRVAVQLAPHAVAFALLVGWVIFLKRYAVVINSYTDPGDLGSLRAVGVFVYYYVRGTFPVSLLMVGMGSLVGLALVARSRPLPWRDMGRSLGRAEIVVLAGAIALAMAVHAWVYFSTGRYVVDRYVIPGSFFGALLVALLLGAVLRAASLSERERAGVLAAALGGAVIATAHRWAAELASGHVAVVVALVGALAAAIAWKSFARPSSGRVGGTTFRRAVLAATAATFLIGELPPLLHYAAQNRIDQQRWQSLVERLVKDAPQGAHIALRFGEPYMIETAQGLEANTLLAGRHDLSYSLAVADTSTYRERPAIAAIVRAQVASFNSNRRISPRVPTVVVRADRDVDPVPAGSGAEARPGAGFRAHFGAGKRPYLDYEIEFEGAGPAAVPGSDKGLLMNTFGT